MKKLLVFMMVAVVSIGTLAGCGKKTDNNASAESDKDTKKDTNQETEEGFSFADIADKEFVFSSGAGGWSTIMTVDEKGNFSGVYQDYDMGTVDQKAPNGDCYYSEFTGSFSKTEKIDEYTYSTSIDSITYKNAVGTEEIKDGYYYHYTEAYGLDEAKEIRIYLPGMAVKDLSAGAKSWMAGLCLDTSDDAILSVYGIYNVNNECTFYSEQSEDASTTEDIDSELAGIASQADDLSSQLQTEDMTQTQMNDTTAQIYKLWDDELNSIWSRIKSKLDEDAMNKLLEEQRDWVADKEQKVSKAGTEYEGGSMQSMVENDKAAELTKARVYELAEYLK